MEITNQSTNSSTWSETVEHRVIKCVQDIIHVAETEQTS